MSPLFAYPVVVRCRSWRFGCTANTSWHPWAVSEPSTWENKISAAWGRASRFSVSWSLHLSGSGNWRPWTPVRLSWRKP